MCGLRVAMGSVRLEILLFTLAAYGAWAGTTKEEEDDTERLPSKCEGTEMEQFLCASPYPTSCLPNSRLDQMDCDT